MDSMIQLTDVPNCDAQMFEGSDVFQPTTRSDCLTEHKLNNFESRQSNLSVNPLAQTGFDVQSVCTGI